MEHQHWESVTIHSKKLIHNDNSKPKITQTHKLMKALENAESSTEIKIKKLSSESRQQIIHKRVDLGYDQTKLNILCSFQNNTIKDIEAGRLHPTPMQLSIINRILKLSLKYET